MAHRVRDFHAGLVVRYLPFRELYVHSVSPLRVQPQPGRRTLQIRNSNLCSIHRKGSAEANEEEQRCGAIRDVVCSDMIPFCRRDHRRGHSRDPAN